jgi:predicted nuclease of predicted toxin-antitoxin system
LKILLDENLDWRLKRFLPSHQVDSVPLIGWAGTKNGELLKKASGIYDALITMDSSVPYQQLISNFNLRLIILSAKSNRLNDTSPLMPKVETALTTLHPGSIAIVK